MARQHTQPKRARNAAWFKEKAMMDKVQESGQILNEEQQAFLADLGIIDCHDVQPTIIHNVPIQTDDLDSYDSDYDDISFAKADLMANLSNNSSYVLSEEKYNESLTAELARKGIFITNFNAFKKESKEKESCKEMDLAAIVVFDDEFTWLYTSSLLDAVCKKALNLLKKGLLIRREAVEASKRRTRLLDHKI
nr:hypothetical protein [Tanacetum cinerariifolium]